MVTMTPNLMSQMMACANMDEAIKLLQPSPILDMLTRTPVDDMFDRVGESFKSLCGKDLIFYG